MPFIYAKIYASVIVLVDTGCGGAAKDPSVELTSLREFIETYPAKENDGKPLNPNGQRGYAVICTHCHYDHIGEYLSPKPSPSPNFLVINMNSHTRKLTRIMIRWHRPIRR